MDEAKVDSLLSRIWQLRDSKNKLIKQHDKHQLIISKCKSLKLAKEWRLRPELDQQKFDALLQMRDSILSDRYVEQA